MREHNRNVLAHYLRSLHDKEGGALYAAERYDSLALAKRLFTKSTRRGQVYTSILRLSTKRLALLAFLALMQSIAPANATTQWYTGTIQQVYPHADGSFAIATNSTLAVCAGNGNNGVYLSVTPGQNSMSASGAQNILATVLTAFALQSTVQISYDDGTSSCYVGGLLIQ